jgi:hypothetical protein
MRIRRFGEENNLLPLLGIESCLGSSLKKVTNRQEKTFLITMKLVRGDRVYGVQTHPLR